MLVQNWIQIPKTKGCWARLTPKSLDPTHCTELKQDQRSTSAQCTQSHIAKLANYLTLLIWGQNLRGPNSKCICHTLLWLWTDKFLLKQGYFGVVGGVHLISQYFFLPKIEQGPTSWPFFFGKPYILNVIRLHSVC